MKNNEKIYVTKPILPSKERLQNYIDSIYNSNWLTNFGPLHELLRERLSSYLNIDTITLTANGTLALIVAYKILNVKKAITTPFTFVATISSMLWEGIDLVFADIDKETFCIDVNQVEDLLKKDKTIDTVVAVNVFGNACDIEGLYFLREKYGIKLIFDSSHCFNVYYNNKNILSYGDASTISFHATKLFHTIEGGGIVFENPKFHEKAKKIIAPKKATKPRIRRNFLNVLFETSPFSKAYFTQILSDNSSEGSISGSSWINFTIFSIISNSLLQSEQIKRWPSKSLLLSGEISPSIYDDINLLASLHCIIPIFL
jgi:hypothetical protein